MIPRINGIFGGTACGIDWGWWLCARLSWPCSLLCRWPSWRAVPFRYAAGRKPQPSLHVISPASTIVLREPGNIAGNEIRGPSLNFAISISTLTDISQSLPFLESSSVFPWNALRISPDDIQILGGISGSAEVPQRQCRMSVVHEAKWRLTGTEGLRSVDRKNNSADGTATNERQAVRVYS